MLAEVVAATPQVRWPARLNLHARREGAATRVRCEHTGPLRLLKTLHPEGPEVAHAVLVHPPGGLVGGDRLEVDVQVDAGAHLLITTPAATRYYRSVAGVAAQSVCAHVAAGARLEWVPQETLAYAGCQGLNAWHVTLAPEAQLMAMEVLALGLGESARPFAALSGASPQGRFEQRFEIEGLWRERGVIDAADAALLDGPCGLAGFRVVGTLVWAAAEPLAPSLVEAALDAARSAPRGLGAEGVAAEGAAANEAAEAARAAGDAAVAAASGAEMGVTALHGRVLVARVLAHEVQAAWPWLRAVRRQWRALGWDLSGAEPRIWAS